MFLPRYIIQGAPYVLGRTKTNVCEVVWILELQNNKISCLLKMFFYVKVQYVYVNQLKTKIQIKTFYQSSSNFLIIIWWLAISEPVDIGKSHIPQKKALNKSKQKYLYFGLFLRYITLSYVIWLKNGRLSKFDENIGIWLVKHFDLYLF